MSDKKPFESDSLERLIIQQKTYERRIRQIYDQITYVELEEKIKNNLPFINRLFKTKITIEKKSINVKELTIAVNFYLNNKCGNSFVYSFSVFDFDLW